MSYFTKYGKYSPKLSELERQNRKASPKTKKSFNEVLRAIKNDFEILSRDPSLLSYLPTYCL